MRGQWLVYILVSRPHFDDCWSILPHHFTVFGSHHPQELLHTPVLSQEWRVSAPVWEGIFASVPICASLAAMYGYIWLIFIGSVIKMGINVATYYLFISLDYKTFPTPTWDSPIVILSAVFNLFDELTTFFVIWLIILIPY